MNGMLENKRNLTALGIAVLIISLGMVSANARVFDGVESFGGFRGKCNMTATKMAEDRLDLLKEKLNLSEDAGKEDVIAAIKENRESFREERLGRLKEKLGLPEGATEEEIRAALKEWREENKELLTGFGRRGRLGFRGWEFVPGPGV
jgi:hypothetical protein